MTELRKAILDDLPGIMEIERTCFPKNVQASRSTIARNIKSSTTDFIVAVDYYTFGQYKMKIMNTKQVLGCIIVFYRKNSKKAYIDSLAVLPKYRGQGIATQLKDYATTLAYARGITEIHSDVAVTNKKMIKLNEHLGYRIEHLKFDYYGKDKHAYHMVKD